MRHPKSIPCPETEKYWPSNVDYPELLKRGIIHSGLKVMKRTMYSSEAEDCMTRLLDEIGPVDIAHVHNMMHHLTPSIFQPLRKRKIPIIWTLHDFSLLCPNTNFFDQKRGRLCAKCLKGGLRFAFAPLLRCKKSSLSASLMAALESWRHRIRKVPQKIDMFISPSRFLKKRFVEAGFNRNKIEVMPNFGPVPPEFPRKTPATGDMPENYALFAGRLSPEKGLTTLVGAWRGMPPEAILRIAGTGPIEDELRAFAKGTANIEFLGYVEPEKLTGIRRRARYIIVSSTCWENAPLTVLEAFSDGIPVLGSNIGGIPEMVRPGITGELFDPNSPEELRDAALAMWRDPEKCRILGENARNIARSEYSPELHIKRLEEIYSSLINTR